MNRIEEIFGHALDKTVPQTWTSIGADDLSKFSRVFAELIVRECADICERFGESGDGYTCSAEILEHFGVGE